jgi:hypothetical protein
MRKLPLSDAMLTVIISALSDLLLLLPVGYSICSNLLVQFICCWTRIFVGVRGWQKGFCVL